MTFRSCSLVLLAGLVGLGCRTDPSEVTFFENVGTAFEDCRPGEIRYLSSKHNFMLAFEPCGSNNFSAYAWSPTGTHLYFHLPGSHHIMHAEAPTKDTKPVPTDSPTAPAAWLDANRVAVPVAAAEGSVAPRIQIFDHIQRTVRPYTLEGLAEPRDLVGTPDAVWFTASADGARHIYRLNTDDGAVTEPFPWSASLADGIDTFTYTPTANAVAIGSADHVHLFDAATGESRGSWPRARRGSVQPSGEWLALEYEGDPISLFYQRAWDELSERARERERRRAAAFEESLPSWYPTEIRPPRISMVNLASGERWDFTGFYGDHFQWYDARDTYASFILWGFESKQVNTNIVLGNLADRLRAIAEGEEMFGIARWRDATTPPPIDPPTAAAPELGDEAAP